MKTYLFLHGALGTSDQWSTVAGAFSGNRVYNLNLPYHGFEQGSHRDFTVNQLADYLGGLLQGEDLEEVIVAGYSLGGYIGLKLMADFPDRVSGLMTYGTKFHWDAAIAETEAGRIGVQNLLAHAPAFAAQLEKLHGPDWMRTVEKVCGLMRDLGAGGALGPEDLKKVHGKVLLMVGEMDRMVSVSENEEIGDRLRAGEVKILPGCKHPLESVDPEWLIAALKSM